MSHPSRAGFTLIEALIALTLTGLVLTKLTLVMDEARRVHQEESTAMALEDQAGELIDRISFAIVGSAAGSLDPKQSSPLFSNNIKYQLSLGVENGAPVWGDPEQIWMNEDKGEIDWGQNLGQGNARTVVWANTVSEMLQDEILNGVDDNHNGVADELGLSFVLDGNSVHIQLTLERKQDDGKKVQATKTTTVTCRN